ncbi:unnamed protein product [Schistocephalus solidus]|uniref:DUF7041 domain-containing protein n=1 Tax=Schistocephalus solidus TaxID=70667 RepID=A0A183TEB6_SCHSO|nr:unnamed protein product [Schistocephalus solidus]
MCVLCGVADWWTESQAAMAPSKCGLYGSPTSWDLIQVWRHARGRLRPRQQHVPSPASGLLASVLIPGIDGGGGDSATNAPTLFFLRIESSFHSANITKEATKFHRLVQALSLQVLSQVQAVIQSPPADQPHTQLKAALLRLHTVSDRKRYHQLIREECLGDRKPTKLLRRMQTLRGELYINDKLFKEMILERLPTDFQTTPASSSEDLSVSWLAEMANRMLEVQRLQLPSIAQLSTSPVPTPNAHLVTQMAAMTAEMASLKLQLARLSSSRSFSRLTRNLELVMSVVIIPILAQRYMGALPSVPSNPRRETSLSE